MALEAQIYISRFAELAINASERLVRLQGRHLDSHEMLLRFRKNLLDYELIVEGPAASLYPIIDVIQSQLYDPQNPHAPFGPKEMAGAIGVTRWTAARHIKALLNAGTLRKIGHGQYQFAKLI